MSQNTEIDSIEIRPWIKRGGMLFNAYCLDIDDPDHVYNQIVAMGKRPEDYGIRHPYEEEFGEKSRQELIGLHNFESGAADNSSSLITIDDYNYCSLADINDSSGWSPQQIGEYLESVIEGGPHTPWKALSEYEE